MSAAPATQSSSRNGLSTRTKAWLFITGVFILGILLFVIFGNEGRNETYQPQNEFKLDPWIKIKIGSIDMSINKAVLYLALASAATILTLNWIANRMQSRPNLVQTAVETAYTFMRDKIAGCNIVWRTEAKWFTIGGTLVLFIW